MSMTMEMGKIQINPSSIPSQIWEMPEMPRYEVVNLDEGIDQDRIAAGVDPAIPFGMSETGSTESYDAENEDEAEEDTTGRTRLTQQTRAFSAPKSHDDDWDK
jgi:hypothetical protein